MDEQKKKINKILLILILIGIVKFILGIFSYIIYTSGSTTFLADIVIVFLWFEAISDGTTSFIGQPIAVLVYSIVSCRTGRKNGTLSKLDIPLAIICIIIWSLAACACWQATMLGF